MNGMNKQKSRVKPAHPTEEGVAETIKHMPLYATIYSLP